MYSQNFSSVKELNVSRARKANKHKNAKYQMRNGYLEQFSNECRKTKTKVITLANQKRLRQSSTPIKTRSN